MKPEDKSHVLDIYRQSLAKYGDAAEAVHWNNSSQRYRFKTLTEIALLEQESVLDFGCGKGDLYQYLLESGFRGSYTGYDINPELIALAQRKFPRARFEIRDIERDGIDAKFSYALISGIFNNRISDNISFMQSALRICFGAVTKGLAFNAISTYVNFQEPEIAYISPEDTFSFCMKELSHYVTLRHDAIPFNFTVYVYRKDSWRP